MRIVRGMCPSDRNSKSVLVIGYQLSQGPDVTFTPVLKDPSPETQVSTNQFMRFLWSNYLLTIPLPLNAFTLGFNMSSGGLNRTQHSSWWPHSWRRRSEGLWWTLGGWTALTLCWVLMVVLSPLQKATKKTMVAGHPLWVWLGLNYPYIDGWGGFTLILMLEKEQLIPPTRHWNIPFQGPGKGQSKYFQLWKPRGFSLSTTQLCLCGIEAATFSEQMSELPDEYRGGL